MTLDCSGDGGMGGVGIVCLAGLRTGTGSLISLPCSVQRSTTGLFFLSLSPVRKDEKLETEVVVVGRRTGQENQ